MNACPAVEPCCDRDFLLWCSPLSLLSDFDLDFPFAGLVLVAGGELVGEDFIIDGLYIGMLAYRGATATL